MPGLQFLPWDSEFFGRRVLRTDGDITAPGEVRLIDEQAALSGASLVYHFQSQDGIGLCSALCAGGFRFIQQQAMFFLKEGSVPDGAPRAGVTTFRPGMDSPEALYPIALAAGKFSRFALEPSIGDEKTAELYRHWVDNSCSGLVADRVMLVVSGGNVRGFCTLQSKNGLTRIGLIGVEESARREGVGASLMLAARREAASRGEPLSVTTQTNNLAAMNFYFRCGLRLSQVHSVFHKDYGPAR